MLVNERRPFWTLDLRDDCWITSMQVELVVPEKPLGQSDPPSVPKLLIGLLDCGQGLVRFGHLHQSFRNHQRWLSLP